jgi:DNA-binding response OmpR family regulator
MNGQSIKILLVEDNAGDARLVRLMLSEGSTGSSPTLTFNLTHVEQLNQAQKVLNQETFDLILLDLSLPDGYGLDTVSRVRHLAPDVAIVVMSGLSDEALAVKSVQEGAQDYLVKLSASALKLPNASSANLPKPCATSLPPSIVPLTSKKC